MNHRKSFQLFILLFVLIAIALGGCEKKVTLGKGDFFAMRKITLNNSDKEYLLSITRAMLNEQKYEVEKLSHPILFKESETRGAFITLVRHNENALCAFGIGKGIAGALEDAAEKMRRLAGNEEMDKLTLRLDIIDESTDIKTQAVNRRWPLKYRERRGIIFDTEPTAAFLPDELMQRNIIAANGTFYLHRLKKTVEDRGIGKKVALPFDGKKATIDFAFFTSFGFMEDGKGGVLTLLSQNRAVMPLDADSLLDSAIQAGEYLKENVRPDGRFNYIYWPQSNRYSDSYNLLRHAGTIYSMLELYEVTGDPEMMKKIELGLKFMLDRVEGPAPHDIENGVNFKALFSAKNHSAKSGGTALCMIALAKYTQVTGDRKYVPLMQEMARFIQHMTEPNGHLIWKYFKTTRKEKPQESIYYPGECALALTRLYELDGNKEWIDSASLLVDYMVNIRDKGLPLEKLPHDHWLCICLNELVPVTGNEAHKQHMLNIAESIYRMMRKDNSPFPEWIGSFYTPPRATPAATRNEGIIASYLLAKKTGMDTEKWYNTARTIAGFELRLQYDDISGMYLKHPDKARGAFKGSFGDPSIRIDFVQHNISALLGLWKIEVEKKGGNVESLLKGKVRPAEEKAESKPAA